MSYALDDDHLLGTGGTAEVYWIDENRAVKAIHVGLDKDRRRETMAEIQHMENLRKHYGPGQEHVLLINKHCDDGRFIYIEMDRAACSLRQLVFDPDYKTTYRQMILQDLVEMTRQCFYGLEYLHGLNIIHQDIKPDNILLLQDLSVKLSDFGLARQKITDATTPGALQALAGTWPYMAPEMHVQHHKNQKYSDIWSLAITAIELFTQQRAWRVNPSKEEHKQELWEKKKSRTTPEGLADVVELVRPLLAKCLNYNYNQRPTAGYMKDQLAVLRVTGTGNYNTTGNSNKPQGVLLKVYIKSWRSRERARLSVISHSMVKVSHQAQTSPESSARASRRFWSHLDSSGTQTAVGNNPKSGTSTKTFTGSSRSTMYPSTSSTSYKSSASSHVEGSDSGVWDTNRAPEGLTGMTVAQFLDNLREIMEHPEGQLGTMISWLEDNFKWLVRTHHQVAEELTEGDMDGLYALLKYCQEEGRSMSNLSEARRAVDCLYTMLVWVTGSHKVRELMCQSSILAQIAQHLAQVRSDNTDDQSETVGLGLAIIANCAASPSLRLTIAEQTLYTLSLYVDPTTNDTYRVIDCINIIEFMEAREMLTDREWPDYIMQALSDLLARIQYYHECQGYMAPTAQDGSGILIPTDGIMRCLAGMRYSTGGNCRVLDMLHQHQDKLADILEHGHELDKKWTTELLTALSGHSCTLCVGGEWTNVLLDKSVYEVDVEVTQL